MQGLGICIIKLIQVILPESHVKEILIFQILDDTYFSINYLTKVRQRKFFSGQGTLAVLKINTKSSFFQQNQNILYLGRMRSGNL